MEDGWITAVWILTLVSAIVCISYGAVNWNKEDDAS
ncbi:symporter small accessory protein [Natranaerofaba carboxydovora]